MQDKDFQNLKEEEQHESYLQTGFKKSNIIDVSMLICDESKIKEKAMKLAQATFTT